MFIVMFHYDVGRALDEMATMERLVDHHHSKHGKAKPTAAPEGWEIVIDRPHLKVWRRFMKEYDLFEYRGQ